MAGLFEVEQAVLCGWSAVSWGEGKRRWGQKEDGQARLHKVGRLPRRLWLLFWMGHEIIGCERDDCGLAQEGGSGGGGK